MKVINLEHSLSPSDYSMPGRAIVCPVSSRDEEWLLLVKQIVLKNMTHSWFQISSLADSVYSSERQLYRRLRKLTGFSPNQFIQELRLQTAKEWLEIRRYSTVKEVCYAVGFKDPVYFSHLFLNRFGRYPRAFFETGK